MLRTKALQNLAAGELLLERGLVDAAMSRLYYAAYQAAVARFTDMGLAPGQVRSGAVEWDHSMVANNARVLRGRWADRNLFFRIRDLRVIADYRAREIARAEVETVRGPAADLVRELTA